MILSTNQPYFAPYSGFFQKMLRSDVMVILDDVQFPRGTTWITRNRLKNDQGCLWMTIPVWKKGLGFQKISEVRICHEGRWQSKHLGSIRSAYRNAPYLQDHDAWLQGFFSRETEKIAALDLEVIRYLQDYLQIETRLVLMSELGIAGSGVPLLVEACGKLGASTYLVQASAKTYLNTDLFERAGIQTVYFKPTPAVYPQLWGDFLPDLSALDVILNCGAKARDLVRCGF
jgi:hypothetical protein